MRTYCKCLHTLYCRYIDGIVNVSNERYYNKLKSDTRNEEANEAVEDSEDIDEATETTESDESIFEETTLLRSRRRIINRPGRYDNFFFY